MSSSISRIHDEPLWTTAKPSERSAGRPLTLEAALYAVLAASALLLRFAALGRWPLLGSEAETALAALRTLRGSPLGALQYSPLLHNLNLAIFALTRATDASTRLLPALLGSGLVLVPLGARDLLGRRGALVAATLLAFSPTWVFFSRLGTGALPSAVAVALVLLASHGYWQTRRNSYLYLGITALGLGLTVGSSLYTLFIVSLVYALGVWFGQRRRGASVDWREALRASAAGLPVGRLALVLGGLILASATCVTLNLSGLAATIGLAGRWAKELAPGASGLPWYALGRNLLIYEALTLSLAILGAVWGLRRHEPLVWFALTWLAVALVLGSLLGHRDPSWMLDALLPLVLLAARGAEFLWVQLGDMLDWRDGAALWLAFCFFVFGFFELASYTHNGQREFLWYALISWGILIAALVAQGFWTGLLSALRVGVALILLALSLLTIRSTTAVAFQTGRDPREGLVHRPTSVQARDLETALRATSYHQIGDPTLLDLVYEQDLGPLVAWSLRDYPKARAVPGLTPFAEATALVTRARSDEDRPMGYAAQRFRSVESWPEQRLSIREKLRWLVYRDPVGSEAADAIQLWIKLPQGVER